MTELVSEIKTIPHAPDSIYRMLSDLSNLEKIRSLIPADKVSEMACDHDSCTFNVAPVGKQTLRIVEREENKTIKLTGDNSPIEFFLWVQLKEGEPGSAKMKMTVKAKLNPFIKTMVEKPMREGIEKLATIIASLPYGNL
jgi:carbon monoxide dehydrogenase subunit G